MALLEPSKPVGGIRGSAGTRSGAEAAPRKEKGVGRIDAEVIVHKRDQDGHAMHVRGVEELRRGLAAVGLLDEDFAPMLDPAEHLDDDGVGRPRTMQVLNLKPR